MKLIVSILKGILIGIANIIPGVSGGTMAVSMGIYDQIIGSITNLFKQFKKSVLTLLPYLVGMLIAIVGVSYIIEPMFEKFPLQTASLFIGLILGGLPIILKKVKGKKVDGIGVLLFLLFFALIIGLQFLGDSDEVVIKLSVIEVIKLFFIGVLASATMVIPGVSGSMILLSIGYYNPIIETINQCTGALSPWNSSQLFSGIAILLPFGIGVVVGIFAIAKLIEFLLHRFERKTYDSILGLICASPIAIFMSIGIKKISVISVIVSIVTFAIGFAVAYLLGGEKNKEESR